MRPDTGGIRSPGKSLDTAPGRAYAGARATDPARTARDSTHATRRPPPPPHREPARRCGRRHRSEPSRRGDRRRDDPHDRVPSSGGPVRLVRQRLQRVCHALVSESGRPYVAYISTDDDLTPASAGRREHLPQGPRHRRRRTHLAHDGQRRRRHRRDRLRPVISDDGNRVAGSAPAPSTPDGDSQPTPTCATSPQAPPRSPRPVRRLPSMRSTLPTATGRVHTRRCPGRRQRRERQGRRLPAQPDLRHDHASLRDHPRRNGRQWPVARVRDQRRRTMGRVRLGVDQPHRRLRRRRRLFDRRLRPRPDHEHDRARQREVQQRRDRWQRHEQPPDHRRLADHDGDPDHRLCERRDDARRQRRDR